MRACCRQIELDIERTMPFIEKYKDNKEKMGSLKKVLTAFSVHDPQIGYMQGMNFIASALVSHCDDFVAFWLLAHLIEHLEMRDLYLPSKEEFKHCVDLPGLQKHLQIIDYLILKKLGDLYSHFCENDVKVDMFCSPWLFSLFGMMIPLDRMVSFNHSIIHSSLRTCSSPRSWSRAGPTSTA